MTSPARAARFAAWLGLLLALALLAIVGVRAWSAVRATRAATSEIEASYAALAAAEGLRADIEAAGRAWRGFVIARDGRHRDQIQDAFARAEEKISRIDGTPEEVEAVRAAVDAYRDGIAARVADIDAGRAESAREWVEGGRGEALTAAALAGIDRVERHHRENLTRREREHAEAATEAATEVAIGAALTFVVVLASLVAGLRESRRRLAAEERFRGLLETSPDGLVILRADGRIDLVNLSAERLFGWTRGELVGRSIDVLVPDASRARHAVEHTAYMKSPQARRMGSGLDLRGRRKDGTTFPVDVSLGVLRQGTDVLVTASIRDLTEIRRVEDELQRWAEEARDLYDNAPCGYHSLDARGRFLRVNVTEAAWFGLTTDQLIGRSPREFMTAESQASFDRHFREFQRTSRLDDVEFDFVGGDGRIRTLSVTANLVRHASGTWVRSRTTLVDVTERRRVEAERERLIAELRQALADVRTLSGMLPICAWCKKVRDDQGYWEQIDAWLASHTDASITHGICPDCMERLRREQDLRP